MDIDRHAELFGARQERRKFRIVEERAANGAADQRALETVLGDRALQLISGGLRHTRCKVRKRGKAVRPLGYLTRKSVIEFLCKLDGFLALKLVRAWRDVNARLRQHLHRNAVAIHVGKPATDDVSHLVG